jgi:adenylate cyclase
VKTQYISILIGFFISCFFTFTAYEYIDRTNQNAYVKNVSKTYDTIELLQYRYDDVKLSLQPYRKTKANTALIAIDDASVEEIGRWPWSREVIHDITSEALKYGANNIAFDIVFSEPERENPQADKKFGKLVEENTDRIILGTASTSNISAKETPYKDICRLEAFLYFGGGDLVKPNITFVVDDETENFESYNWKYIFQIIFGDLTSRVEKEYLDKVQIKSSAQLNRFQKNALRAKLFQEVNKYCGVWLEPTDAYTSKEHIDFIMPFYQEAFKKILSEKDLREEFRKIQNIKAHPIRQYVDWLSNVPEIQTPASYTAGFNTTFDSSGLIRHYNLFNRIGFKIGSSYIPSVAMQMYLISEKKRADILFSDSQNSRVKFIKEFLIKDADDDKKPTYDLKVDEFARIRLNYLGGTNSFYYVSAKDLLEKNSESIEVTKKNAEGKIQSERYLKKDFFKDKSLLFGATAVAIGDIRNTPVEVGMPGPETHLNAYANLIDHNYILDIKNSQIIIPVITFVLGIFITIIWTYSSPIIAPVIFISSLCIGYLIDLQFFLRTQIMTTTWPLYAVVTFSFVSIIVFKYFTEERSKKKIRQAFSKYVSPAVVDELLKNEKNLELGGKKQRLTVMFSDLRGFTTFSEKLDPQQLSEFLNIYFTKMTDEVFKAKGTLDKFIGDAVMAFFGAPLTYKNNAENACRCALNSLLRLTELNVEFQKQGYPLLDMGIGLNTGDMSVGNMGSSTLQNYTVLGDSVNLAARLEGLNKDYGTHIIIGSDTYEEVKNIFVCRELDLVRVKGKKEATPIYELISEKLTSEKDINWLTEYNKARDAYKNRNFIEASMLYEKCISINPQDKTSKVFLQRSDDFKINPPDESWDGTYNLDHK